MSATTEVCTNDPAETIKRATETTNNGSAAKDAPNAGGLVPEWLKAELFVDLLQKNVPNFKSIKNFTPIYMECVRTYEGHEEYYDSLQRSHERFADELRPLLTIDPNEFNVLNHGDFWINNVMFQYDDAGKLKETYFVDFQMTRYGPPINDLYSFLLLSPSLDMKLKHFDYFIKYYHDNLIEYLKLLKYSKKLPTLKEIHLAMLKYGSFGVNTVITLLPLVLLEANETASIANIIGDSEESRALKKAMYTNSRYREHVEVLFPWLYHPCVYISIIA
ncbi:uncharacterized protein LOC120777147 [Bactrocera tryoni]|uniref:uncharacterized protein LOC120777147 n=1 Tax=Bactrocera tryoni TaxID=59916 RepID=UPI001A99227A|nr:uncharacterized protein LOC120777147 [Bactrocera tryoni]